MNGESDGGKVWSLNMFALHIAIKDQCEKVCFLQTHKVKVYVSCFLHSVFSRPAHPFRGLVLQVFFGQFGLVEAGISLLAQNLGGLSCWYFLGRKSSSFFA